MVLAAAMLVAAGCPRTPPSPAPPVTPMVNSLGAAPSGIPPTTVNPTMPTGEMGDIVAAHNKVTSYHVVVATGSKVSMKADVKAADGKPVALLVKGNMLIQPAEQTVYLLDAKAKTAKKIAYTKTAEGFAGKLIDPMVLAAKSPQVTDTKLGKLDCWLLVWTGSDGAQVSVWVGKQNGLPLQRQSGKSTTTYTYSNINKVPESAFTVPKGYANKEMTTGVPGGPGPAPGTTMTPPAKPNKSKASKAAANPSGAPGLTPAG
jgi:hypothetical protein